jgi:MHS family proline/betaine transporter-like MFS transporter
LATVIAVVFSQSDPLTALMAAYAIFAISFILRPLGGIFGATLGTSLVEKMHYLGRLS